MENRGLVLLSKFAVSARRLIGVVNPTKLIKDHEYSAEIFQKVSNFGDEELILLSLEIQNMLGLMSTNVANGKAGNVVPIKTEGTQAIETSEEKYLHGARS